MAWRVMPIQGQTVHDVHIVIAGLIPGNVL